MKLKNTDYTWAQDLLKNNGLNGPTKGTVVKTPAPEKYRDHQIAPKTSWMNIANQMP